jgi:bile acid:Na+ symporter, BASS family
MSTLGIVQLLFGALAIVMAGLGLSLELADFRRLLTEKRAVVIAVVLQMIVLPLVALGLASAMRLPTPYAVGLMLLAAAPGSISSSLYSHVFGGNVALNMSLTGINTLLSMVTLPLICGWAMAHFAVGAEAVPSVVGKLIESMATLVVPVIIGMVVRSRAPAFAARADRPMRLFSVFVLIAFSLGAIVKEWAALVQGFAEVGLSVVTFNLLSLAIGYSVSRAMTLEQPSAVAITFQLGIRSAVLSIYIAMTALNSSQLALPAAVYSVTMVLLGLAFGLWVKRSVQLPSHAPAI